MTNAIINIRIKEAIKVFALGILIVIGTFPNNDWSFSTGIDQPLKWVFNYICSNGFNIGRGIIFPHGPLAFFMYPLADNVLFVTLAVSGLKVFMVFNVYRLLDNKEESRWLLAFFVTYLICIVAPLQYLILGNIILLYCNYYITERYFYKISAFFLTAFVCYVKAYPGIISVVLFASFSGYYFVRYRSAKQAGYDLALFILFLLSFWLLMFGTFSGIIVYFTGMFHLALDNSSSASFYPDNNWWVLSLFLLAAFLIPFMNKTARSTYFGVLTSLSIFAVWKHAMAREDVFHFGGLIIYMTMLVLVFVLFDSKHRYRNLVYAICAVFLLTMNSPNTVAYRPRQDQIVRVSNFFEFITDYSVLKKRSLTASRNNIASKKLPHAIRDSISNATVDVYPWDYSIIAANELNWRPRVVIQSYAAYTPWLEGKNADHFKSSRAPVYLIWDLDKRPECPAGQTFSSVDNRYLLNDEPQALLQMVRNYRSFYADSTFLVLKKRTIPLDVKSSIIAADQVTWGQWTVVPGGTSGLLRARLTFEKNFIQRAKSFFYKDEEFRISLKFGDGQVKQYKIVPDNAAKGIWINPFIFSLYRKDVVKQIMFGCSNPAIMVKRLNVEWEQTDFGNTTDNVLDSFFPADIRDTVDQIKHP